MSRVLLHMPKRKHRYPGRKKIRSILLLLLLMTVLPGIALALLVRAGVFGALPARQELLEIRNPLATEVYTADGVLMGTYHIQNRQHLDSGAVPQSVMDALVATEDARFYEHRGIDYRSLGRVFVKSLLMGNRSSGGGSTLTQQLAKNLFPRGRYGPLSMPVNKIREMMTARRIEELYSKEEILMLYLSTVPFGENTFGLRSASLRYFHREPGALSVEEAAILVGMLKATMSYNPVRYPDRARERRNVVLGQMARYGYLEEPQADSLRQLPLELEYHPLPHDAGIAPYFREFLRRELEEWCEEEERNGRGSVNLYTDGLRVFTTIDSRLQAHAESAVQQRMARLQELFDRHWDSGDLWSGIPLEQLMINYEGDLTGDMHTEAPHPMEVFSWNGPIEVEFNTMDSIKHYLKFLQAGFLAMETGSARIRAWVGGIDHRYFKYDHVLARRQAGSTFKPIVYLEALRQGTSPCEFYSNDSVVYEDYDNWTPRNADGGYGGFYSLKGALVHSVNTISVKLIMEAGIDSVIRLARMAGIRSPLPPVPSLALGSGEVSLLEMVGAYQAMASEGVYREPVWLERIEDREGHILYQNGKGGPGTPICSPEEARLMTALLNRVVTEGTAGGLPSYYHIPSEMAGKTGTTQDYTDGWFIGYTPGLVAGAWVGGDLPRVRFRTLELGQGAHTAMPIWGLFMQKASGDPVWRPRVTGSFGLDPELLDQLDCENFQDREPHHFRPFEELRKKGFFRKLFQRRKQKE